MQEDYSNPQELRMYEDSVNAYRDIVNAIKTAEKKMFAEGKAEGRAEGWAEGRAEEKSEVARRLIEIGMSKDDIFIVTGLFYGEVFNLKK